MGERLNHQIAPNLYKTASALLLLIPETPMLFQGQEWASSSPFQFFTDHNAELGKLVTEGRRREFGKFKAFNDPAIREKIPDPQAESTFTNSKLKVHFFILSPSFFLLLVSPPFSSFPLYLFVHIMNSQNIN